MQSSCIPSALMMEALSLSGNGVKVLIAVWVKTVGFGKETDQISDSQLRQMTNIKGREALRRAILEVQRFGIFDVDRASNKSRSTVYTLTELGQKYHIFGSEKGPKPDNLGVRKGTETFVSGPKRDRKLKDGVRKGTEKSIKGSEKGPKAPFSGPKRTPHDRSTNIIIINNSIDAILERFQEETGLTPNGLITSQRWEDEAQDILDKASGAQVDAAELVSEAYAILKGLGYASNVKKPKSLIKTIDNLLEDKAKETTNAKRQRSKPRKADNPDPHGIAAQLDALERAKNQRAGAG